MDGDAETIGEYDKVVLTSGRTVTISRVLVPGKEFLYWDEDDWDEDKSAEWVPPEVPVTSDSIARIVWQSEPPVRLSPDGWAWLVGEYAELGYATPLATNERVTVQGQLFRRVLEITPHLFELITRREYECRSFLARNPAYDAEQIARGIVELWESIDYNRELRERDFYFDIPDIAEWIRRLDSEERRKLIDERTAQSFETGDLIADDQGRTLVVVMPSESGRSWVFASQYDPSDETIPLVGDVVEKRNIVGCVGHTDLKRSSFLGIHDNEQDDEPPTKPVEPQLPHTETQENRSKPSNDNRQDWIWCLVGNIKANNKIGYGRAEGKGTRLFSAGTKLYVYPPQFGDGFERMVVLAKPRGRKGGLVQAIVARSYACNFRIQKVWKPEVVRRMRDRRWGNTSYGPYEGWDSSDESKTRIKRLLGWINLEPAEYKRYLCALYCDEIAFSFRPKSDAASAWDIRITYERTAAEYPYVWRVVVSQVDTWRDAVYTISLGDNDPTLGRLLVESNVHLWDEFYEEDAEPGSGFAWTLQVLRQEYVIMRSGQNAFPPELRSLLAALESRGVPFAWDGALPKQLCGDISKGDLSFIEAMRKMEADDNLRGRVVLLLVGESGSHEHEHAGLKLLRLDAETDSCPYFSGEERAAVAVCFAEGIQAKSDTRTV